MYLTTIFQQNYDSIPENAIDTEQLHAEIDDVTALSAHNAFSISIPFNTGLAKPCFY